MSIAIINDLTIDQICSRKMDLLMSPKDFRKIIDVEKEKAIEKFLEKIEDRFYSTHPDERYYTYTPSSVVDICKEIAEQMKKSG